MANDDRTCPNCRGLVSRGEEFCPTCGEWLGIAGGEVEQFTLTADGPVPPGGDGGPPPVPVDLPSLRCPLCGADNPPSNRHCEQCGARLASGQMPVAPQPAIQTTAAMRTAILAAIVLLAVVAIAFVVNAVRGDDDDPIVEATTTTAGTAPTPRQVTISSATCTDEWPARPCSNLIDGTSEDWNAPIPPAGQTLKIDLQFEELTQVEYIEIENLPEDDPRFRLNHRVAAVRITSSDVSSPFSKSISDTPGKVEPIQFRTLGSLSVSIEIASTWASEPVGSGEDIRTPFEDVSIAEIRIYGTPATTATTTATTTTTP